MSQFYNRYVPPPKDSKKQPPSEATGKRKREGPATNHVEVDGLQNKNTTRARNSKEHHHSSVQVETQQNAPNSSADAGKDVLEKYSISQFARSQDKGIDVNLRRKQQKHERRSKEHVTEKHTAKSNGDHKQVDGPPVVDEEQGDMKHNGVLRKYEKSKRASKTVVVEPQDDDQNLDHRSRPESTTLHDLVPIPQPQSTRPNFDTPTYSVLPAWQARAITVEPTETAKFQTLGLSDTVLTNLRSNNIEDAFAIQSRVIPLLLAGRDSSDSDMCISAATGSGKTLAYVVPIVDSLLNNGKPGLHAVIVVPTRELVKQVKDTCEMCASGSRLRIVTAVGSKSMSQEQKALVEEEEFYDPAAYEKEMQQPVDWTTFNLEKEIERVRRKKTGYVIRTRIKADILVTTPGRLVDHLQNTDGFHLDDVKWLVVDEADRLLNESYQEWMVTVMPALRSRRATEREDRILSYMRINLAPRKVRKVLLSATMTRDISKLSQFDLHDPKLIVLDIAKDQSQNANTMNPNAENIPSVPLGTDSWSLPSSLQETAVVFKEDSEKPLLLLQLLDKHLGISTTPRTVAKKSSLDAQSSSSSSEDDFTSSSGSDTSDAESEDSSDISSSSAQDSNRQTPQVRSVPPQRKALTPAPSQSTTKVLIFTRSTASASRLSRLLGLLSPSLRPHIATLTRSTTSSASSRKALPSFRNDKIQILVATDRASRGIDVPGLQHVISYDVPGSALAYIHRAGRTARAGLDGNAWTMVEHREGRWFWNEIGGKSDACKILRTRKVKRLSMEAESDDELRKSYEIALEALKSEVRGS